MSINPLHNAQSIARAYGTKAPAKPAAPASSAPAAKSDRLELSNVDHLMTHLKTNDVRWSKVNEIKAQIAGGSYDTDDKLDAAADKMLDDVL